MTNMIDTTTLEHLLTRRTELTHALGDFALNNNQQKTLEYLQEIEDNLLEIGKEYCRITADRNSMDVAKLIRVNDALSLIDSIKNGRYV
jgi:hypothetical protein